MFRLNAILFCSLFALVSCGGGGGPNKQPPVVIVDPEPEAQGLLIKMADTAALENYIRDSFSQLAADNAQRSAEVVLAEDASQSSTGFTTTYTVEANVDEHDYVKYNGDHLFIAPSRGMDCCFIVDDIAVAEPMEDAAVEAVTEFSYDRSIRILATDPSSATANQVASIELPENRTVEGLYNSGTQLVSISSTGWWGAYGERFADPMIWQAQTTAVDIYDISNIAEPSNQMQIEMQGAFVNSRKKDDVVYLIARHTPSVDNYVFYPSDEQQADNQAALDALTIDEILPKLTINGEVSDLLVASDCLVTDRDNVIAPAEAGYPIMTLLVAIDLAEQTVANAACYLEPTSGVYVSENAIYLAQEDYAEAGSRTIVHSFNLSQELEYMGSGAVAGQLTHSGNRDFRINEHSGYLRLVTTEYTNNSEDWIDHRLSVLRLAGDLPELETIATLPNTERPEAIGKPNEDLYGVRFMGDKLYMVTFERIDPLYVLDLSNPVDPMIAGELTVTGFSDFLHPVSEELLLGLGQDEEGAVKLELFNIANMNAPYSLGAFSIGAEASWSYSEARYDRHAFTYQSIDDGTDRFSIPVSLGLYDEQEVFSQQERLYLFEINGKDNPVDASVDEVGFITATKEQWWDNRHRAVFHNDAVFFVNGTVVWSTLWTDPSQQNGPY
ncbi:beta-propeller domain-containing protein [Porticoccaceae bacterium]|nr:beta-propeller domain-containing protein [Porticoccaceae bacterium]